MDSLLSVPILYLLLLFSQMTTADSPTRKMDESMATATARGIENEFISALGGNTVADSPEFVRLLMMAMQNINRSPQWKKIRSSVGIPFRPVRRIGSEFLGKRSDPPIIDDAPNVDKRARIGSEFLGKRRMGSEFLGKRRMGSEFLGKRGRGSEFLGKRRMGSEFLGKRRMGSEFLGKRGRGSEFLGKRRMGSEFLGKRRIGSEFLGKRDNDFQFDSGLSPLSIQDNPDMEEEPMIPVQSVSDVYSQMEKRGVGSEFLGKRKPNAYEFTYKRGRLGSEFLGKRSVYPDQPIPFLQTDSEWEATNNSNMSNAEEKSGEIPNMVY